MCIDYRDLKKMSKKLLQNKSQPRVYDIRWFPTQGTLVLKQVEHRSTLNNEEWDHFTTFEPLSAVWALEKSSVYLSDLKFISASDWNILSSRFVEREFVFMTTAVKTVKEFHYEVVVDLESNARKEFFPINW